MPRDLSTATRGMLMITYHFAKSFSLSRSFQVSFLCAACAGYSWKAGLSYTLRVSLLTWGSLWLVFTEANKIHADNFDISIRVKNAECKLQCLSLWSFVLIVNIFTPYIYASYFFSFKRFRCHISIFVAVMPRVATKSAKILAFNKRFRSWNKTRLIKIFRKLYFECVKKTVTSMLVAVVGEKMCWWQVKDVDDRFNTFKNYHNNYKNLQPNFLVIYHDLTARLFKVKTNFAVLRIPTMKWSKQRLEN